MGFSLMKMGKAEGASCPVPQLCPPPRLEETDQENLKAWLPVQGVRLSVYPGPCLTQGPQTERDFQGLSPAVHAGVQGRGVRHPSGEQQRGHGSKHSELCRHFLCY